MWRAMARRYRGRSAVVVLGLKNEPRAICQGLSWGVGAECSPNFTGAKADEEGCVEAAWARGPEHLRYRDAVSRAARVVLEERGAVVVSSVAALAVAPRIRSRWVSP